MTALPRECLRLCIEWYHILRCLPTLVKKRLHGEYLHAKADTVKKLHKDGAKIAAAAKEMKIQKVASGIMVNNIAEERMMDPNEQVSQVQIPQCTRSGCPDFEATKLHAEASFT